MFEDSLLESSGSLAKRNPQATCVSFALQVALAGMLFLIPLLCTDGLPVQRLMRVLNTPDMMPPVSHALASTRVVRSSSDLDNGVLRAPSAIPRTVAMIHEEGLPSGGPGEVIGAVPGGEGPAIPGGLSPSTPGANPLPKLAVSERVRISSGVAEGMLVRQVKPHYPSLAVRAHVQGTVELQALIGKDGTIQNLRVMSGPPLLIESAMDAVRQWRYQPFYLNGQPVEVETQINVHFTLGNSPP